MSIPLGYIYASIAGDLRYQSRIQVFDDGETCRIELAENGAVGGMDGDGRAYDFEVRETRLVPKNPHSIVKCVKDMIKAENPQVIAKYGKVSKRFTFVGADKKGLSVHLCKQALGIDE
jgi:hypothetical protein